MEFKPYFIDNYNEKILQDLYSKDNLVICSSLGSGKSTSVKKYIHDNKDKKILLVVNKVLDQTSYHEDLDENLIYVETTSRVKLKEAVELLSKSRLNCVCITKVRFNYMVTVNTKLFDDFDKIIIDEQGGLSPIFQDGFDDGLKNLLDALHKILKLANLESFENIKELIDFLYYINEKYVSINKTSKMSSISIEEKYRVLANSIKDTLLKAYDEDILKEHDIVSVLGLLNSLIDNKFYLHEFNNKFGKKTSSILYCNRFLKNYITSRNIPIIVLDGTAKFISPLYEWLGFTIKEDYIENLKEYPNMMLHYYKFNDVKPYEGRNDKDVQEKMLKFIEKEGISKDFLLFTNKSSTEVFEKEFDNINYAFSGDDVGTNKYQDEKNLVVVFFNTLPQSYRMLYNMEIKGLSPMEASSQLELDIAEAELVGSMMVQLVGRTAIRKDNNARVNIYMLCVSRTNAESVKEYYKLKQHNIKMYDATLDLRKKVNLSVGGLFYMIDREMQNNKAEINIEEIAQEYYGDKYTKDTLKNLRKTSKDKLEKCGEKHGYVYEFKSRVCMRYLKG